MYKVLTIAGSDSCCGAGVQADLKTITALGAYGTCAVTAITAQNTLEVSSVFAIPAQIVGRQISAVAEDMTIDSVKTGMLVGEDVIEVVCDMVKKYHLKNLVVDPVINSHKGERLLSEKGLKKLITDLIPLSCLVTPNIPEAEILTNLKINNLADTKVAAGKLSERGAINVLIKGGHFVSYGNGNNYDKNGEVTDLFYDGNEFHYFREEWIDTANVHGTGCMYSAAIATELAKGHDMISSITTAKKFITEIIKESSMHGKGCRLADFSRFTEKWK